MTEGHRPAAAHRPRRSRTTVRRLPEKQVLDVDALRDLLDTGLLAHVAVPDETGPLVVPLAYARDGDRVLVHGSTASRTFAILAGGVPSCLTVTLVDGLIVARSQFESSMRYRSAMLLGRFAPLQGPDATDALAVLAARLLPGLTGARTPDAKELKATVVLAMPIDQWSLKVSDGHPDDAAGDLERPVWAGTVPLHHVWGEPEPAPDLATGLGVPAAVAAWPDGRS